MKMRDMEHIKLNLYNFLATATSYPDLCRLFILKVPNFHVRFPLTRSFQNIYPTSSPAWSFVTAKSCWLFAQSQDGGPRITGCPRLLGLYIHSHRPHMEDCLYYVTVSWQYRKYNENYRTIFIDFFLSVLSVLILHDQFYCKYRNIDHTLTINTPSNNCNKIPSFSFSTKVPKL